MLAPALRDRYDLTLGETGFLIGGSLLGSTVSLIPWGLLADRVGERWALAVGLGGCGAGLVLAGQATTFWQLAGLLMAAGCAGASVQSASGRAVMQWFGPARRGLALGIRQTAIPIGGLAASLALPHLGPQWAFRALGLACVATGVVGAAVVREGPVSSVDEEVEAVRRVFRNRRIWVLSLGGTLLLWPQMCVVGFTVLYLHERRGVATGSAALVLALVQVLSIVARIGVGAWSDLLRSRVEPLRRIAIALAVATCGAAALAKAPLWLLVPMLVVAGVIAMSWNGLAFTAAAEVAGARAGAAIGLQQTLINAAAAALPPAFGLVVAATGWTAGFALVALGPLAAFAVLRAVPG